MGMKVSTMNSEIFDRLIDAFVDYGAVIYEEDDWFSLYMRSNESGEEFQIADIYKNAIFNPEDIADVIADVFEGKYNPEIPHEEPKAVDTTIDNKIGSLGFIAKRLRDYLSSDTLDKDELIALVDLIVQISDAILK